MVDSFMGYNGRGFISEDYGPYPDTAMRDSFYLSKKRPRARLSLEGLKPNQPYKLTLFGARIGGAAGRLTRFQVGNRVLKLQTHNNTGNTVIFERAKADPSGSINITVSLANNAAYAHLGLLTIEGDFFRYGQPVVSEKHSDLPLLSAASWGVLDVKTKKMLAAKRPAIQRQIGSLTKVMTAWLVLQYLEKNPKAIDDEVVVSSAAVKLRGKLSRANLQKFERISVKNLLYALLLPSGTDAAIALAEYFGSRINNNSDKVKPYERFVEAMNKEADRLGLKDTVFVDPHGLSFQNVSTTEELAKLSLLTLSSRRFKKIVATVSHEYDQSTKMSSRTLYWYNTNKLLKYKGYYGIKTGTTKRAGNCLIAAYKNATTNVIVLILGAPASEARYSEARNLVQWAVRKGLARQNQKAKGQ